MGSFQPAAPVPRRSLALGRWLLPAVGELEPGSDSMAGFVLDHVPGLVQLGDDPVGTSLGDVERMGDVSNRTPGSWAMQTKARPWLVRKLQLAMGRL